MLCFFGHKACGIKFPGIEPTPPALEAWHLNPWTTRKVSSVCFITPEPLNLDCSHYKWSVATGDQRLLSWTAQLSIFYFILR